MTVNIPIASEQAYVRFISVDNMMRLINRVGVAEMIAGIAEYIEADFRRWPVFDKTPRVPSHSRDGVIELMPTSDGELYGFKYVNGHPANMARGYQTVTAFGVLSRVDNGYPLLLTEMTMLTALRTAATSALVAQYLAPAGARTMAMIGNGAQCEFQAIGFQRLVGIDTVRLFDVDRTASEKAARNLSATGLKVVICGSAEQAVEGAEIITTCTADKKNATILTDNLVGAGVHLNAIGGDCPGKTELHADIIRRASVFVEYPPQTRIEGEIQQLATDHPVTEFWQVIAGTQAGRTSASEVTLFDSVGFAIEDFAALRYVHDLTSSHRDFDDVDMLADPDDPRDLYGMLCRAAPAVAAEV